MKAKTSVNLDIPVKELVDKRLDGASFDGLAAAYDCSKMQIYVYYEKAKERGYDGYEPISVEEVKKHLRRGKVTIPQLAEQYGVPYKGFRLYMLDRGIGREPTEVKVRNLKESGKSLAWIARFYGLSYGTFKKFLKQHPGLYTKEELALEDAQADLEGEE